MICFICADFIIICEPNPEYKLYRKTPMKPYDKNHENKKVGMYNCFLLYIIYYYGNDSCSLFFFFSLGMV